MNALTLKSRVLRLRASPQTLCPPRVSGVLGFPARREIGDCYIWGAWSTGSAPDDLRGSADGPALRQAASSPYPVLLHHTHTLDVIQARPLCASGCASRSNPLAPSLSRCGAPTILCCLPPPPDKLPLFAWRRACVPLHTGCMLLHCLITPP
jgi:hypothetical protein